MPALELTDQEWQTLTVILADVPWKVANPILYKMAAAARDQAEWSKLPINPPVQTPPPKRSDGRDREPWSMPPARDEG